MPFQDADRGGHGPWMSTMKEEEEEKAYAMFPTVSQPKVKSIMWLPQQQKPSNAPMSATSLLGRWMLILWRPEYCHTAKQVVISAVLKVGIVPQGTTPSC